METLKSLVFLILYGIFSSSAATLVYKVTCPKDDKLREKVTAPATNEDFRVQCANARSKLVLFENENGSANSSELSMSGRNELPFFGNRWLVMTSRFPVLLWYEFKRKMLPAKVSFQPNIQETWVNNQSLIHVRKGTPSEFDFVGSVDTPCNTESRWEVICQKEYKSAMMSVRSRGCKSEATNGQFRCLGLRIWDVQEKIDEKSGYVLLKSIKVEEWIFL